jgi:hypothetical protein
MESKRRHGKQAPPWKASAAMEDGAAVRIQRSTGRCNIFSFFAFFDVKKRVFALKILEVLVWRELDIIACDKIYIFFSRIGPLLKFVKQGSSDIYRS